MQLSSKFKVEVQEELLAMPKSSKKLSLGVPSEDFRNERRVALTPFTAKYLVDNDIQVVLHSKAGKASGFTDLEYAEVGVKVVETEAEVFTSDVVLKIAPPNKRQRSLLGPNQMLISTLNIKTLENEFFEDLMRQKVTAIALEYIQDESGNAAVVDLMNMISGQVSINIAIKHLEETKGKLLGGVPGNKPVELVVLGAGSAALSVVKLAIAQGATVKLFDRSVDKMRKLEAKLNTNIYTSVPHISILKKEIERADVVVGALSTTEIQQGFVLFEDDIKKMKHGSLIIDLNIDHGSCIETSCLTSFDKPSYQKFGVTHYGLPNMPSMVPRTSSYALGNVFLQQFSNFHNYSNFNEFLKDDMAFKSGLYLYNGFFVKKQIADIYKYPCQDIDLILAAF